MPTLAGPTAVSDPPIVASESGRMRESAPTVQVRDLSRALMRVVNGDRGERREASKMLAQLPKGA
jgi:hypothetical protein